MTAHRTAVLAAALALVAGIAHAQVYQWKDAKGVTHYGDAPPAQGEFHERHIAPPPAAAQAPAPAATGKPAPGTPADATAASATARRQANCQTATANLERLQKGGDVGFDANGDGKPDKVLGADERAQQAKVAQQNIASYCQGGATSR